MKKTSKGSVVTLAEIAKILGLASQQLASYKKTHLKFTMLEVNKIAEHYGISIKETCHLLDMLDENGNFKNG